MAKFKIQKDLYVNQYADAGNIIGGTGGNTSLSSSTQILPNVFLVSSAAATTGSILQGKGRSKFKVFDGNSIGVASLANVPNANLVAGQMSIGVDTAVITAANVNVYTGGSTTYAYITYNINNVSGPATAYLTANSTGTSQYVRGTGISGNVNLSSVVVTGTTANANVALGISQTVSNVASATLYVGTYAARLTNKFVIDFTGAKYAWKFTNPTSTTVRIPGA